METRLKGIYKYAVELKLEEDLTRYKMIWTMEGLLEYKVFFVTYAESRVEALVSWNNVHQLTQDQLEDKLNIPLNITVKGVLGPYPIEEEDMEDVEIFEGRGTCSLYPYMESEDKSGDNFRRSAEPSLLDAIEGAYNA